MGQYLRKPGTFWRALVAFIFMNAVLGGTAWGMIAIAPVLLTLVWVQIIAAVLLGVMELCIWMGTIQDPLASWIKGEYYDANAK